jgi:membrane protein DedA with SNARE-associated domain
LLNGLANQLSGAWWSYLLIFGVAYLDVLIPLVPSETTVITAGVLSSAGDMHLSLVILAGGAGAVAGDNTAYLLGHYFEEPLRRGRLFRGEKAQERIVWAERQINERGGQLIVIARFIPAGRTVVTLSCGTLGYRWRRFVFYDAIAATIWAVYAALLGYLGGHAFEEQPWKGLLLAFAIAFAVTGAVELVRWFLKRRSA